MLSFQLWRALQNPNNTLSLYLRLRNTYKAYQGWASADMSAFSLLVVLLNLILAPLFVLLPLITIFLFGAYWAGFVAGEIQNEHMSERFELLALLPDGGMAVCWVLSVLHMRHTGIYRYALDGLRITVVIGAMILFVLSFGVMIALLDESASLRGDVLPLVQITLAMALLLGTLYVQQVQAVILSQLVGIAAPSLIGEVLKTRAWASALFLFVQILLYAAALTLALTVIPANLPLRVAAAGFVLIAAHEWLITRLWHHLQHHYGDAHLERLMWR